MQNSTNLFFRAVLMIVLTLGLAACGGGGGGSIGDSLSAESGSTGSVVFGGSVGDGPVTGATVTVKSAKGYTLGTLTSDSKARYRASIQPTGKDYPLRLVVNGGIDLVTGRRPDFRMESVMVDPSETVVNINPFSTLIVQVAERMHGGLNGDNVRVAKSLVMNQLSFGLRKSAVPDPISSPIISSNIAHVVKASEAMGESIRRTRDLIRAGGRNISGDAVMAALAADMTDGYPDGLGKSGTDSVVTAVFNVVRGQVLVELLSNNLRVDGVIATGVMDQAIRSVNSGTASNQLTDSVRTTANGLSEARTAVAAARVLDNSPAVANLAGILGSLSANATPGSVEQGLPADSTDVLDNAVGFVPNATSAQINSVNQTVFAMSDTGTVADTGTSTPDSGQTETGGGTATTGTGNFSLRWTAPVARSDGTALSLSEINGYRIYYGTGRGQYPQQLDVTNGTATSATVNNLASGTYYLVMTTYDNSGRESARSPEVVKNVP